MSGMSETNLREARHYERLDNQRVLCHLCPKTCRIAVGRVGACRVRKNIEGKLYTLNYGEISSAALDPVEKKPLYHFYPGREIFSVGTFGCNLHCAFCQNWRIAHGDPVTERVEPGDLVAAAVRHRDQTGSIGIAYTYSEPLVWFEFVFDTAVLAHKQGLKNVLVTNGLITPDPLLELLPYIDAMNIDVKGFTEEYYREVCRGSLAPVRETVERAYGRCHLELTCLIVPGKNDAEEELADLVDWIAGIDRSIPLHLSRYFPNYLMDLPPTPLKTLARAREIALKKLNCVYVGNTWEPEEGVNDTFCPFCGHTLVRRSGYLVSLSGLKGNRCRECGREVAIVN